MKEIDLSTYNNDHYKPGSAMKRLVWYFVSWTLFQSYLFPFSFLKVIILRLFGAKIAKGVVVKPCVQIKYPWFLEIGANTWVGEKVWIDNLDTIRIGANVCLSQGAMLLTGNHNYKKTTFDLIVQEIVIADGVWIGAQATVCPGVVCKTHAVLSVGSVATTNLEAYTIYMGNPATAVRERKMK